MSILSKIAKIDGVNQRLLHYLDIKSIKILRRVDRTCNQIIRKNWVFCFPESRYAPVDAFVKDQPDLNNIYCTADVVAKPNILIPSKIDTNTGMFPLDVQLSPRRDSNAYLAAKGAFLSKGATPKLFEVLVRHLFGEEAKYGIFIHTEHGNVDFVTPFTKFVKQNIKDADQLFVRSERFSWRFQKFDWEKFTLCQCPIFRRAPQVTPSYAEEGIVCRQTTNCSQVLSILRESYRNGISFSMITAKGKQIDKLSHEEIVYFDQVCNRPIFTKDIRVSFQPNGIVQIYNLEKHQARGYHLIEFRFPSCIFFDHPANTITQTIRDGRFVSNVDYRPPWDFGEFQQMGCGPLPLGIHLKTNTYFHTPVIYDIVLGFDGIVKINALEYPECHFTFSLPKECIHRTQDGIPVFEALCVYQENYNNDDIVANQPIEQTMKKIKLSS